MGSRHVDLYYNVLSVRFLLRPVGKCVFPCTVNVMRNGVDRMFVMIVTLLFGVLSIVVNHTDV